MIKKLLPIILLYSCSPFAQAQLGLTLDFDEKLYAKFETINATLSINNTSGKTIYLNDEGEGFVLRVAVFKPNGDRAATRNMDLLKSITPIPAGQITKIKLNLQRSFDLFDIGQYKAQTYIDYNGRTFESKKRPFDLTEGAVISNAYLLKPDRLFTLRRLNRDGTNDLIIRTDSSNGKSNYAAVNLGETIRGHQPIMQVSGDGYVHVVYQPRPKQFIHAVIHGETGRLIEANLLRSLMPRGPGLVSNGAGGLKVAGAKPITLAETHNPADKDLSNVVTE